MISTHTLAFFQGIGGPEMVLIFLLVLILFGGQRLPDFARGLGKSIREFKKAASGVEEEIKRAMEDPPPRPTKSTASLPAGTEPHKTTDYDYDYEHQDPHADYSHPDYPYDHSHDHAENGNPPSVAAADAGPSSPEPSADEPPAPPSSSAQVAASPPATPPSPPEDASPPPPPRV